jgi:hypothetical protein
MYDDLQAIVTPGQFKSFILLMDGNYQGDRISITAATCYNCGSADWKLDMAVSHLASALGYYQRDYYCDYPHVDNVLIYLGLAHSKANNASNAAQIAFSTCDCTSAQQAQSYANTAMQHLNTAINNTATYCETDSPWINHMNAAKTWLTLAINKLPSCVSEACN